jgi:NitT/TauT family transport system ATP-binding protein/sulfonate transport system ATP-binding protein
MERVVEPDGWKIRAIDLGKSFDEFEVIKGVTFDVRKNEFLSIVGPTGCGKTTLAKIIAGIIPATTGNVLVDGQTLDQYKAIIGFVFQQDSCLPWLNVLQNVMLGLVITRKGEKKETRDKALEMIKLVNLEGYEKYYPIQLSGGMKQRVAIARAFCLDTEILIMDEPFGQVDVQTRYYMEKELQRIWEKYKKTVIFITNHDEEAIILSDRVIKLSQTPAVIDKKIAIDIPRPRDNLSPEFMEYRRILASE